MNRQNDACAQAGIARIAIDHATSDAPGAAGLRREVERFEHAFADERRDLVVLRRIREIDLRAQAIGGQALAKLHHSVRLAVEQVARVRFRDDEVVQILALRREQGGVDRLCVADQLDIVGNQILQKRPGIPAIDRKNSAFREGNELSFMHLCRGNPCKMMLRPDMWEAGGCVGWPREIRPLLGIP